MCLYCTPEAKRPLDSLQAEASVHVADYGARDPACHRDGYSDYNVTRRN